MSICRSNSLSCEKNPANQSKVKSKMWRCSFWRRKHLSQDVWATVGIFKCLCPTLLEFWRLRVAMKLDKDEFSSTLLFVCPIAHSKVQMCASRRDAVVASWLAMSWILQSTAYRQNIYSSCAFVQGDEGLRYCQFVKQILFLSFQKHHSFPLGSSKSSILYNIFRR